MHPMRVSSPGGRISSSSLRGGSARRSSDSSTSRASRGLSDIREVAGGPLRIGALTTYSQILQSEAIVRAAFPLAQACLEVGSPPVRNRGTLAGAVVTARSSGDLAPVLVALGAEAELRSLRSRRRVPIAALLSEPPVATEMIVEFLVPSLEAREHGLFVKMRTRRGQVTAMANLAMVVRFDDTRRVERARLVYGRTGAALVESIDAEDALVGHRLDEETIARASERATRDLMPEHDGLGSADYRRRMLAVMTRRGLRVLRDGTEREHWPERPVTLSIPARDRARPAVEVAHEKGTPIEARVNGRAVSEPAVGRGNLLDWLRDGLGLTGTKDACSEGVCGACTVHMDGDAVLACLVPAQRAHGLEIRTVEGLAEGTELHPLQRAFVDEGAVQCGYCTPGFLMAGAALLAEHPQPDSQEVEDAFAGNLCRCTGYYAIRRAMTRAGRNAAEG